MIVLKILLLLLSNGRDLDSKDFRLVLRVGFCWVNTYWETAFLVEYLF